MGANFFPFSFFWKTVKIEIGKTNGRANERTSERTRKKKTNLFYVLKRLRLRRSIENYLFFRLAFMIAWPGVGVASIAGLSCAHA